MRHETTWRRAWRRVRMAIFITVATGSIRIAVKAATRHCLVFVSTFLRAGGNLSLDRVEYEGTELALRPDGWTSLIAFEQLLAHGAQIRATHEGFDISLPSGRVFGLPSEHLVPSALVVLQQRFVADEYADLKVAGSVVIDIGANIGDSAVYFADNGAIHVYAFEPFSELYETAAEVMRRNRLEDRVTVVPRGVGPREGRGVSPYDPIRHDVSLASLQSRRNQPQSRGPSTRAEEFELVSLSSLLRLVGTDYPGQPLVIKFDCEGCEFEVLEAEGIGDSLRRVKSILLEVHEDRCHTRTSLWRRLEDCGFSVRELQPSSLGGLSLLLATREGASKISESQNYPSRRA